MFHSIVPDARAYSKNIIDPALANTTAEFREAVEHFLERRYVFLSPLDVARRPGPGNFVLITFDDGYANNRLVMPLLEEYGVPGVFFLSTGHIERGTCFWWDVLYRERTRRGAASREIHREADALARTPSRDVEAYLRREFGDRCLEPLGELDRPFTRGEIAALSACPGVWWGNHTVSHALLGTCPRVEALDEIGGAGEWIGRASGTVPAAIAYPDGSYTDETVEISRSLGLKIGVTTEARKNSFPLDGRLMRLGRFAIHTGESVRRQCERMSSELNLTGMLLNAKRGH